MAARRVFLRPAATLVVLLLGLAGARSVWAQTATTRVATAADGRIPLVAVPGGDSRRPQAISSTARFVVLVTNDRLVAQDTDDLPNVYVVDRATAATELLPPFPAAGYGQDLWGYHLDISDDGRIVAVGTTYPGRILIYDRTTLTYTRADVGTGGVLPNVEGPVDFDLSADGRVLAFYSGADNLVAGDVDLCGGPLPPQYFCTDVFVRDLQTGITTRVSVGPGGSNPTAASHRPSLSADGRHVAFSSDASNLVSGDTNGMQDVFVHDRQTGTTERVSLSGDGAAGDLPSFNASISGDGRFVAFLSQATTLTTGREKSGCGSAPPYLACIGLYLHDRTTGSTTRIDVPVSGPLDVASQSMDLGAYASLSDDGRFVAFQSMANNLVAVDQNSLSDVFVYDRLSLRTWRVTSGLDGVQANGGSGLPVLSRDGRGLLVVSVAPNLVSGDVNGLADVFLTDLDADADGMLDIVELEFGLDVTRNDANEDPDLDGATNGAEVAAGTHPRGLWSRYFAEGATSAFFDTRLALLNTAATDARVLLRFQKAGSVEERRLLTLPPRRRLTVDPKAIDGLREAEFSTVLEADASVVVDRTLTWDGGGYGAHAETGIATPSTTWYLAEGATHSFFDLFYLLQNPADVTATVEVTYLLPAPAVPLVLTYAVAPRSRQTIWVDLVPGLESTDVSASIRVTNGVPIVVERAMYQSRPGQRPYESGHESAGVTAPSLVWFLAEGASTPIFDTFLLIANPTSQDAAIQVRYLRDGVVPLSKGYDVPANSRLTIWTDVEQFPNGSGHAVLDNAGAFSMAVTSMNLVPVVAERAMWFPGGPSTWNEAHGSPGTTVSGVELALAEGEVGGPREAQTYILIANATSGPAPVRVTLFFEDGTSRAADIVVPGDSRRTIGVGDDPLFASAFSPAGRAAGTRFGATVESFGAPVVVERAMYWSEGGYPFAAGTSSVATRLR